MMKFIRDCFTGVDGTTWDFVRVLVAIGCIGIAAGMVVCCVAALHAMLTGALDYAQFGTGMATLATGFAAIIAAGGASLFMKRMTEPTLVTATKTDPAGNTSTASVETGSPASPIPPTSAG